MDVAGPMLVVALVLALAIGARFHTYDGDVTGFILFGELSARQTQPPPGAVIESSRGYDAQYFWIQAKDPLLLRDATIDNLAGSTFRLQRMGYPTLAYLLALGHTSAIPWTFLAINVLAVVGITLGFALYARRRGWSGWWALALGLMPGLVLATLRDLSDPLAVAAMVGGLIMWQLCRRWWAAVLFTVAVLSREPIVVAVVAVAIDAAVRWWQAREDPTAFRQALSATWPVVVVPAVAFLSWQAYINVRYGGNVAGTSPLAWPPFEGLVDELRRVVDEASLRGAAWELAYLGLVLAALGTAAALVVRRRIIAASLAALLLSLSLLIQMFGDHWSYTRLTAPVFAALLLAGLELRSRFALGVCVASAALTAFVPLAFDPSGAA